MSGLFLFSKFREFVELLVIDRGMILGIENEGDPGTFRRDTDGDIEHADDRVWEVSEKARFWFRNIVASYLIHHYH